jgi:hypothetical protein
MKGGQMNRRRIKGKIVELFGSQQNFAQHIGQTEQTISKKLRGKAAFSQEDIIRWCEALQIPASEVGEIFFASELSKS